MGSSILLILLTAALLLQNICYGYALSIGNLGACFRRIPTLKNRPGSHLEISSSSVSDSGTFSAPNRGELEHISNDETYRPIFESGLRYKKDDWWKCLVSLPSSYVLLRIRPHLIFNVAISIAVVLAHEHLWPGLSIPMLGHNLLGGFLGLLLVFRQNTAYSRFWDARCTLSKAAATTRTMAVDIITHIRPLAPNSAERLLELVAAFPDALAYSCLGKIYPLAHNVKKLVVPKVALTKTRLAPATILCIMMQEELHETAIEMGSDRDMLENLHLLDLSHEVGHLASCLKACERILNTPVPWSYSRHASRFLTIYTATLPLAVVSTLGWLTVPVMTVLCWCLFGIEEIVSAIVLECEIAFIGTEILTSIVPLQGHLIEQPFVGPGRTKRAQMTKPYDIGLPVFILSNQARLEVEDIAAIQPVVH